MKQYLLTVALAAAMTMGALSEANAQVPDYMNYQGRLTLGDGSPIPAGEKTLEINIYNTATGNTVVWGPFLFDGQSGNGHGPLVAVLGDGRFNVVLGETDSAPTPRSLKRIFAEGSNPRFIELKVDGGSPILPRQQFLMAPYAARATNSDQLGTRVASGFAHNNSVVSTTVMYGVPTGTIIMYAGADTPAGWREYTEINGRFPMGAPAAGETGGTSSHTHTVSGTAAASPLFPDVGGVGISIDNDPEFSRAGHTHTVTGTAADTNHLPPFYKIRFLIKL